MSPPAGPASAPPGPGAWTGDRGAAHTDPEAGRRPSRLLPRLAAAVLVAAAIAWALRLLAGGTPVPAPGPDGSRLGVPPAVAYAADAQALADGLAAAWRGRQDADGRFRDPVGGAGVDYGSVMLGVAIARRGWEARDQGELADGLDALQTAAEAPTLGGFELLATADAFRWADERLAGDPRSAARWAVARRPMARYLSRRSEISANSATVGCLRRPTCYGNQKLVGALALAALLRTDLQPRGGQALLARPELRDTAIEQVAARIVKEVGEEVSRSGTSGGRAGGVLSDPPRNPLAYHALSVVLLARLVDEQPVGVTRAALDEAFARAGQALVLLAAPDGDLSYLGRGQGQTWVPAATAQAGALVAARTTDPELRARSLALVGAALGRLRALHRRSDGALDLLPRTRTGRPAAVTAAGIDPYAGARSYNGLAIEALDAAASTLTGIGASVRPSRVPATADGVTVATSAGVATITRGDRWLALASRAGRGNDARYGPGVLALRAPGAGGSWQGLIPERPRLEAPLPSIAIEQGGRDFVPDGEFRPGGGSSVLAQGRWVGPGGAALEEGSIVRWALAPGGTVQARVRFAAAHTLVVRAVTGERTQATAVAGGVRLDDPAWGASTWTVLVDGQPATPARSARARISASAYATSAGIEALRVAVPAGATVELRIAATPPASG